MISLLLVLFLGVPRIGQFGFDTRSGGGIWIAGDGFTNSSFKAEGISYPVKIFNDKVMLAYPNIEQIGPYTQTCVITNKDGSSKPFVLNQPVIYGMQSDPTKLYYGRKYSLVGQHLCATKTKPTAYLETPLGKIAIPIYDLGGMGSLDPKRVTTWISIPETVPTGAYNLYIWTGENDAGTSNKIPVIVMGQETAQIIDIKADNGSDVTIPLLLGLVKGTESSPTLLRLPPGLFYLSQSIEIPSNSGILGSYSTVLTAKPGKNYTAKVANRIGMLKIIGENTLFKDITLEIGNNCSDSILVAANINRARFENVGFLNVSDAVTTGNYTPGTLFRSGTWKYWQFINCNWRCQCAFEANVGPFNGFVNNGGFDNSLILNGTYRSVYGRASASLFGDPLGRASLIQGLDLSSARRGFAFKNSDGCMESVISQCNFNNMLSETGKGENILIESRGGLHGKGIYKDGTVSFVGDTFDRTRWTIAIISGTGQFQYRKIAKSNNGTHTLETDFEIQPDDSSVFLVSQCPTDCTFTWNRFSSVVGGINFYGNAFGNVLTSNWLRGTREGVMINTNWNTANTNGFMGQAGDGCSVNWFGSYRLNTYEDGAGFHLVAPRADNTLDFPQIAFQNITLETFFGNVVNQIWCGEGVEQKAIPASGILVDYLSMLNCKAYQGFPYLHPSLITTPHYLWYTNAGTGNFIIGGTKIDDITYDSVIKEINND